MSLRAFHILFIVISTAFAIGFGAWLTDAFLRGGGVVWLLSAIASLCCAAGMAVYAVRFARKTRDLRGAGGR